MAERGRPTTYTAEIAEQICQRLAAGMTLREICRDEGFPPESTVRQWVLDNREGFSARYAKARELMFETLADEIVEIADDGTNDWQDRQNKSGETCRVVDREVVSRSALRVDARKWLLSKLKPNKYGDKVQIAGEGGGPVVFKWAEKAE